MNTTSVNYLAKRNGFTWPRRQCIDRLLPTERQLRSAIDAVEALGAHPRLTDAVMALQSACDAVADWAEETGNVLPDEG